MPTLAPSQESIEAFDQALFDACALLRPPEHLTLSQWSDKYMMLSPEGSARPGRWHTANAEYQREIMDSLTDPTVETTVFMASSQVGKSQSALNWCGYIAHHDPGPILFVEPDENLAKTVAKDRIDPMIRDVPVLVPLFGRAGKKGSKNDTLYKAFPGGQISLVWASSPTQMASRPVRYVITDEEGAYDAAPNKEGDPVELAKARMATFPNRKHFRVSSPRNRRTCSITKAFYELSDQRHYYVPCPHCGEMQTLEWDRMSYKLNAEGEVDPATVFYTCLFGCVIEHFDKGGMIRKGEWRAHAPGRKIRGYHISALYSTLGFTWTELCAKHAAIKGDVGKLQTFTNTMLGLPWDEQAEGADMSELQKHAEDYEAEAPAGIVFVTCGADVQKNRIEASKWGWGLNHQAWLIEHRVIHGETDNHKTGAWPEFDEWRRLRVEHQSGLFLPVACTFVDSSDGNRTAAVYDYCKSREAEKVFAIKGSSQPKAPLVSEAKRWGRNKVLGVTVGTSTAKDTIFARLQITDKSSPGYTHFPKHPESGASATYFQQLTAEALVTHHTRQGERAVWEKQRPRNETLDCYVYAFAAKAFTRAPIERLATTLKARIERMTAEGKLQPSNWLQRRDDAEFLRQSLAKRGVNESVLSAISPASPSQLPISKKKPRKSIKRPGFAWIHWD